MSDSDENSKWVLIAYSGDSKSNRDWVKRLQEKLEDKGVGTRLWNQAAGTKTLIDYEGESEFIVVMCDPTMQASELGALLRRGYLFLSQKVAILVDGDWETATPKELRATHDFDWRTQYAQESLNDEEVDALVQTLNNNRISIKLDVPATISPATGELNVTLEMREQLELGDFTEKPNRVPWMSANNSLPNWPLVESSVFVGFATNRRREGIEFGNQIASQTTHGFCRVQVPEQHKPGVIERPAKRWWWYDQRPDPEKHFFLDSVLPTTKTAFLRYIDSSPSDALVFIHGFNVSFEEAAIRTAQLHFDLRFQGKPFFFSWPSHESISGYVNDGERVHASEDHISQFLDELHSCESINRIFLIGHSMGTRGLTGALVAIQQRLLGQPSKFKELILAEPDISQDIFREKIEPKLLELGARITLYASKNDRALGLSERVNKGVMRLGQAGRRIFTSDNVDTIDTSDVGATLFGLNHSEPLESREFFWDMTLILEGRDVSVRPNLVRRLRYKHWYLHPA